ncbi:hypothetical protein GOD68_18190 [Sinorhizobium medicae]|nr:hypothetical protein [Sinorhizobium medicae]
MNWMTINKAKLEKEINDRGVAIDTIKRGRSGTKDLNEAANYNRLLAEHNALMAILNCLD